MTLRTLNFQRHAGRVSGGGFGRLLAIMLAVTCLCFGHQPMQAQTGGEAGIQGTVADATGAAIPNATVIVKSNATGVELTRQTNGDGLYTVSPIIPGVYTVTVKAAGFETFVQKNLQANALVMTPLNIGMKVGAQDTTVEVTGAPPALETTNATLGLTIQNETYTNLPLTLNGQMRDPTAFGTLAPGAQGGARLPLIGGTGNYLGQLYLDGLPAETVSQQGDNRVVSQSLSVDAVDQMQVVTSTPPAEYAGAGAENFTMKSGTLQYHGSVKDFLRNTALDAWQFVKPATGKPIDHQNELAATFSGHVPGTKRIFFFVAYDKYHNRTQNNAASYTIPTLQMRTGDFRQLGCLGIKAAADQAACATAGGPSGTSGSVTYGGTTVAVTPYLYDPTTNSCPAGSSCSRQPFVSGGSYNVIPSNYISAISQAMEQWLPTPTNSNVVNNYTAPLAKGYDNHAIDWRVDFDWTPKHRISTVGSMGAVNYLNNFGAPNLPLPYVGGDNAAIFPKAYDVQDAYTISNTMVNQFKFGYVRFFQNISDATQNTKYGLNKLGVTNLPSGQGGYTFPLETFNTTTAFGTAQQAWRTSATSTQLTTPNNFALVDNLQWVKGAHSLTFGISIQWQQINNANPATFTGDLSLAPSANSTANYVGTSLSTTATGYSYASFLLGAYGTTTTALQYVSEEGGRYRPIAPYVEDTWKVNSKLTIDAGLRWDYLPPYREVKDHWSFLNPTGINPATGTAGYNEFAGNYGGAGVSCQCRTPVPTYWNNWGPRVGITFQSDPKTVWRAGLGRVFSQAGGVGGRGGAFNGTGQLGFNTTATSPTEITTGINAAPSFYLNSSSALGSLANTDMFGAGYVYPTAPTPGAATQILDAGHYISPTTNKVVTASTAPGYADPHFSSRAPDVMFYNAGIEHAVTDSLTMAVNYVGNQSHHLINSTNTGTGTARGYWSNQLNPVYLVGLGAATDSTGKLPLLTAPANSANVAKAQALMSGISIPAFYQAAANAGDTTATIQQGLVAYPQYSGLSDTWGNVGNFSYNSLQVTVQQRLSHGLTFNFNYTWARNVGDDGPYRTGYALPSGSVSRSTQAYKMNRIDRSETTVSTPNVIHAFGVWNLPFGKGHIGGGNPIVSALVSGWQINSIATYASGTPVQITYGGCTTGLQGQCMPDYNPAYTGTARQNGKFGTSASGRLASNLSNVQYFNPTAFIAPTSVNAGTGVAALNLIGNAARTGADGLRNPAQWNIDSGVRRTIPLYGRFAFTFEADFFNTLNHVLFSSPNAVYGSSTFGQIASASNSPRSILLAGHITF
ncbi:Carboxypeptidase regulatory-like domain-containing protein [Bryocella elongata]|uniref:Carboxypeptidase regulatory-like domain-containing protein n=1 Tax=Bryocella elongata TaxID=863522 RepID=A0A1H5VZB0_9BACT|nr:carboxypeptidase-like regulatory domain-containing protein [Bryocella elongata]SEF92211.1 Carboxypeptidase regulatory-like domain-containing protein [Bryocella elongata]